MTPAEKRAEQAHHIRLRIAEDVMVQATATFWRRRAEQFEAAKPIPVEFHGRATRAELSAAWRRSDEVARACRNAAAFTEWCVQFDREMATRLSPHDDLVVAVLQWEQRIDAEEAAARGEAA